MKQLRNTMIFIFVLGFLTSYCYANNYPKDSEFIQTIEKDCIKHDKVQLFEWLIDSYHAKNVKNYSSIIDCINKHNPPDDEFIAIFYQVIYSEDDSYALEVIESIDDINIKLPSEEYIIHFATEKGSTHLVKKIIELGGNPNVKSGFNLMPIDISVQKELELFELLLKHTQLNQRDSKELVASVIMHTNRNKLTKVELLLKSDNFYIDSAMLQYIKRISKSRGYKDIVQMVENYES